MGANDHAKAFAGPQAASDGRKQLIGLSLEELQEELATHGLKPFRAKQVWHWIYQRGETDFDKMTTLAKDVRAMMAEHYSVERPEVVRSQKSDDGTRKWLLRMADGQEVEAVFIPEADRGALCISTQVGCTLTCKFCHTGTQKLVRNLTAHEIIQQVMFCRDDMGEWPSSGTDRKFTNIVVMGMGEPLYNYTNIAKALKIIMDGEGIAISKRRITLSTSGVVPMIERCGEELGVKLAISLHAVNNELRDQIMPLNRKYKLEDLMDACRNYPGVSNAKRITFEYVMLKGVNDSDADAYGLIKLLKGIPAKVNLIPFNEWDGAPYECSDWDTIERFGKILMKAGYASPIRRPRGRDISAACGQLKSESQRIPAWKLREQAAEDAARNEIRKIMPGAGKKESETGGPQDSGTFEAAE